MQNQLTKKVNNMINLDYKKEDDLWLQNSKTLRKLIGVLGMALPILLIIITFLFFDLSRPIESISHYYYTRAGSIFTVILSVIAIFLIVYSGKAPKDFYISTFAGIFALFVVFFPTGNLSETYCESLKAYSITFIEGNTSSGFRETFHLISAALFLILLAYMSFFLFTKSNKLKGYRGQKKVIRNRICRVCAGLIVLSLIIILLGFTGVINEDFYNGNQLTFWMETVAVESFGFAWLIKGETMFSDDTRYIAHNAIEQ
ncbi:hypothetical protein ES692_13710 [Psychroserpens burtonensis]|uniref:DUF998 domain-containing protein n=1 Tax=Psychroserpens burtonensis TaxID=49278 RepID=A0A5C7B449_9FLAO|nr:hypothetical protein [Psychroserpens burtonensis]TXE16184.1 hypothetical protein ES692_13710 [Psychroserpens burtonensis]